MTKTKPAGRMLAEASRQMEAITVLAEYLTNPTRVIKAGISHDTEFNDLRDRFGVRGYAKPTEAFEQICHYLALDSLIRLRAANTVPEGGI